MNTRAAAYLAIYSVTRMIAGIPEVVLPLDKLQGFLDLVEPSDVPSYQHVQRLYHAQASAVHTIQDRLAHHDTTSASAPTRFMTTIKDRMGHLTIRRYLRTYS